MHSAGHNSDTSNWRQSALATSITSAETGLTGRAAIQHHAIWAAVGLGAGLLLVLPTVYWSTERPQQAAVSPAANAVPPVVIRSTVVSPVLVSGPKPAAREPTTRTAIADTGATVVDETRERLEAAEALIRAKDIEPARVKLETLAEAGNGEALFLLASTYDPVQLAAHGVTGVKAEAERARHLYSKALAAGHEKARQRLDQLN